MRTYDPADHILYVHLGQTTAAVAAPAAPHPHDECHRLPAGYANGPLRPRLGEPRAAGVAPALVLLPGGSAAADGPAPPAPALRLAR